jgi:prepilin-type N-terminal cleavage/methylation domain-containing protein
MSALARIRRRLAQQRGFTLIEVMVAASVGVVIVGVAFGLLDSVVRTFSTSGQRVDVSQRGRLAVDQLTARLRSQVCGAGPTQADPEADYTPAIVQATDNKVVFWSDIGDAGGRRLRGIEYANGAINDIVYPGADPAATPLSSRPLVTSVAPDNGPGLFRYFAYNPAAWNSTASPAPQLYLPLTAPLVPADYKRVVRITVAYTAYPEGSSASDKLAAAFTGDFVSRTATSPYEYRALPAVGNVEPRCE